MDESNESVNDDDDNLSVTSWDMIDDVEAAAAQPKTKCKCKCPSDCDGKCTINCQSTCRRTSYTYYSENEDIAQEEQEPPAKAINLTPEQLAPLTEEEDQRNFYN